MGQAFMMRRGNNHGFKEIGEPEVYIESSGTMKRGFNFPTSLCPNATYYTIIAQYRDANGNIKPVIASVHHNGTKYRTFGQIGDRICNTSTVYQDDIIVYVTYSSDTALYNELLQWNFEKGFIYEYK